MRAKCLIVFFTPFSHFLPSSGLQGKINGWEASRGSTGAVSYMRFLCSCVVLWGLGEGRGPLIIAESTEKPVSHGLLGIMTANSYVALQHLLTLTTPPPVH